MFENQDTTGVNWDLFDREEPETREGLELEEAQTVESPLSESEVEIPATETGREAIEKELVGGLEGMALAASRKDVDEYSKLLELSQRTGVSPDAFERDPALARQFEASSEDEIHAAHSLAVNHPRTAELLANNPDIGVPSFGEYSLLDSIGKTFRGLGRETQLMFEQRDLGQRLSLWRDHEFLTREGNENPLTGSVGSDVQLGLITQDLIISDLLSELGKDPDDVSLHPKTPEEFERLRSDALKLYSEKWQEADEKIENVTPMNLNWFQQGARMGIAGLATEGPAMVASLIPYAGPVLGTSITYHNSYADHFGRGLSTYIEQGYSEDVAIERADSYARTAATIDGATSLIPFGAFARVFRGAPGRQSYQRATGRVATAVGEAIGGRAGGFIMKKGIANVAKGSVPLASQTVRDRLKDHLASFLLSSGIGMQVDALLLGLNDTWNEIDQEAHRMMSEGDIAGWAHHQLDKQLIALVASTISDGSFALAGAGAGKARDLLVLKGEDAEAEAPAGQGPETSEAQAAPAEGLPARDPRVRELMNAAEKSKMARRSPTAFRQTVKSLGGDDITIMLDREAATEYLQARSREEIEADPLLRDMQERLERTQDGGTDLSFTGTEFVTQIAPSAHAKKLSQAFTTDEGGISPYREARNLGEAMEELVKTSKESAQLAKEVQEVTARVTSDLLTSGRYSKAEAKVMGRVVSAYVMEKARSSGISPEEALTRGGNFLRVLGPMTGRSPVPKGALTQRDPNPRRFRQMDDTDRARKRFAKLQNEALDAQGDRAVFADRMSSSALKGARLFVSEDQRSGFAIDAEGEVVGLFKHPEAESTSVLEDALAHARAHGATKFTGFEVEALREKIKKGGFVESSREAFDSELAPSGWDSESLGTPDVVTFEPSYESTGEATMGFFEGVARGEHGRPDEVKFLPQISELAETINDPETRFGRYHQEYLRHAGHFDDHIAQSIPGYRDFQYAIGLGLLETFGDGATFLDIGASQGTQAKSLSSLSGGKIKSISLDPNLGMKDTFNAISRVEGARFEHGALGFYPYQRAGEVAWTESDGTPVRYWDNKGEKFDIVHEAMTFQFISPDRRAHIARTKELTKEDGIAIFQEKVVTEDAEWKAHEAAKDSFKRQTFSEKDMQEKAETVLTGMKANQVHEAELVAELKRHFKYVHQIWDSGNFKGYAASDSQETLANFARNTPDTRTKWDTRNRGVKTSGERQADGSLVGLPRIRGAAHNPEVAAVAEAYMQKAGMPYDPPAHYAEVNVSWAEEIARLYGEMEHRPNDPEVKAAYDALIEETLAQYEAMLEAGVQIEIMDMSKGDAYGGDPRRAIEDVRDNNHLYIFGTKDGYGPDTVLDPSDNPMVRETKYRDINGVPLLANDVFRAVHDYFGHAKEGVGFRAAGEENAWRAHASMYSPLARRAMTSETRGQNSWVNYGPHGEHNRTAKDDTIYAEQKVGLLPEWVSEAGRNDDSLPVPLMRKTFERKLSGEESLGKLYQKEDAGSYALADHEVRYSPSAELLESGDSPTEARVGEWVEWFEGKVEAGELTDAELRWTGLRSVFRGVRTPVTREEVLAAVTDSVTLSEAEVTLVTDVTSETVAMDAPLTSISAARSVAVRAVVEGVDTIVSADVPSEVKAWLKGLGAEESVFFPTVGEDGRASFRITERAKESILASGFFFQRADSAEIRGYYEPENNIIRLTDAANLTTFLHEFAHFMLEGESRGSDIDLRVTKWLVDNAEAGASETNSILAELADPELNQRAFHASSKILMEFSAEAASSGEGFGGGNHWGVYFTKTESMAEWYREAAKAKEGKGEVTVAEVPESSLLIQEDLPVSEQPDWVRERLLTVYDLFAPRKPVKGYQVDGELIGSDSPYFRAAELLANLGREEAQAEQRRRIAWAKEDGDPSRVEVLEAQLRFLELAEGAEAVQGDLAKQPSEMDAGELYSYMALKLGGRQQASEFLMGMGIPGAEFTSPVSGETNFVIWDNSAMSPSNVQQQELMTARLRQSKKRSTKGEVSPEDFRRYLVEGTSGDAAVDSAMYVARHELIARAFEAYTMEGVSPSAELREPFRKISSWMMQVYKEVGALDTPIDDTVRGVFDRLLASDEEIEATLRARKLAEEHEGLLGDLDTPEARERKASEESAVLSAKEKLRARVMNSLRRMIDAERKGQLSDIEDEIRPRIEQLPVNAARRALSDTLPLDRAAVRAMVGELKTSKTGTEYIAIPTALRGMTKTGGEGVDPDVAARALGYTSGEEMLRDIIDSPSEKTMLREEAEAILKERHGDPISDGTLSSMAETILADEMAAEVLLKRLSSLRRSQAVETRRQMREMARKKIGGMSFREIKPMAYRRAEVRAAREAGQAHARGDREAEATALTKQLLAHYMAAEAEKARAGIENIRAWSSRFGKTSLRREIAKSGGGHLEQIDSLLSRFELRKTATMAQVEAKNQQIAMWAEERMSTYGDALVLSPEALDSSYVTHWKDVPFEVLEGVRDSIKNIEHVARYSNKVKLAEETMAHEAVVDRLTSAWERLPKVHEDSLRETVERRTGVRRKVAWGMAQLTKMSWLTKKLDMGEAAGFSHEVFMQPFTDAWDHSQRLYKAVGEPVVNALRNRTKEDHARHQKLHYIPEIKESLYGHQILAVALNVGNEGNLRKLLLGEGWAHPDNPDSISLENPKLRAVLSKMTKSDWELVQLIWDQMELLYPALADVHQKTTGLRPPRVEATPVTTEFGEFRGGYYPVKYDSVRSRKAADFQERADAMADSWFTPGGIQASVVASATETRTGFYAPIRLSLDVVSSHFGETIHFITHHDAVRQTNRLIRDPKVMKTLRERIGPEEAEQFMPWLRDIAKQGQEAPMKTFLDAAVQHLTTGATLTYMGFKISTGLRQFPGFSNSAAEVGWGNILQGIRAMFRSPEDMQSGIEWAMANSKILPHRVASFDREVAKTIQSAAQRGKKSVLDPVRDVALLHIGLIDLYTLSLPTWYGAYIKEMKASGDEAKAFRYADAAVEMTQGTARIADTAALMRNNSPVHRSLTMFMSWFSAMWNQVRDIRDGQRLGYYSMVETAAKLAFVISLPALLDLWIMGDFMPEEDEGTGEWAARLALYMGMFPLAGIPGGRDLVSALGSGYEYRLSPIEGIVSDGLDGILAGGRQIFSEDPKPMTRGEVKGLVRAAMAVAHIPGGSQTTASIFHLYDVLEEGEEMTFQGLAYGKRGE